MSIFDQKSSARKDTPSFAADTPAVPPHAAAKDPAHVSDFGAPPPAPVRPAAVADQLKESLIAADLTIEGKIEGSGDVRIAGKFKGDVNVQGNLRIESGAKLNGGVRAKKVLVSGELEGNIESASLVELRDSAVLTGDLKAGSLTVAAGSKIRGHIECGWGEVKSPASGNAKDKAASDKSSD